MFVYLIEGVHIIVCLILILVVLLQKGKGQDFASTFGGGGTQTAFGARSSTTILHHATTVAAVLFMITSLTLTIMMSRPGQGSVIGEGAVAPAPPPVTQPLPVTPAGGAAAGETADPQPADPEAGEDTAAPAPDGAITVPADEPETPVGADQEE
jgi:preprotein translocase subunit SecG